MSKKVVVAGILGLAESKSSVYVLLRATVHCLSTGFLINQNFVQSADVRGFLLHCRA